MGANDESIIEIFSGTLWEAEMVKNLLQNAGIRSFLKNDVVNSYIYDPIYASGVKIMISNSDFERAKEIVDEYYRNLISNE